MSTIEWVFGIILAIFAIAIIIVVLLQEGHQKDLGTVTGGAAGYASIMRCPHRTI